MKKKSFSVTKSISHNNFKLSSAMEKVVDRVQSSDAMQSREFFLQDPEETSDHMCTICIYLVPSIALQ